MKMPAIRESVTSLLSSEFLVEENFNHTEFTQEHWYGGGGVFKKFARGGSK